MFKNHMPVQTSINCSGSFSSCLSSLAAAITDLPKIYYNKKGENLKPCNRMKYCVKISMVSSRCCIVLRQKQLKDLRKTKKLPPVILNPALHVGTCLIKIHDILLLIIFFIALMPKKYMHLLLNLLISLVISTSAFL